MSYKKLLTVLLFFPLCFCLYYYVNQITHLSTNHLPVWSDEFMYYMNAYAYHITHKIPAALTFSGNGSEFLQSDAHGFMYSFFHGSIANLFGWHNLNMVYTNMALIILAITAFTMIKGLTLQNKILGSLFIVAYPFTVLYSFTYMQEILQLFWGVTAGIALYKAYTSVETKAKRNYSLLYTFIIVFAALFRPTWLLWLIGLIPLATTKKSYALYSLLFVSGVAVCFVYAKYFFEFVPNFFYNTLIELKIHGFGKFIDILYHHFLDNIKLYFSKSELVYSILKFSVILLALGFSINLYRQKKSVYLAVALVFYINIFFLLICYDAYSWREIRFLSPLYYFSIVFIVKYFKPYIQIALVSIGFIGFIHINDHPFINNRDQIMVKDIEKKRALLTQEVNEATIKHEPIICLVDFFPEDYSMDLLSLPVVTSNNTPIKYIVPYYNVKQAKHNLTLQKNEGIISIHQPITK